MGVKKNLAVLDLNATRRGEEIVEGWAKGDMRNSNAAYESLWDDTAPGDSSQDFSGHDHARSGGPICRGVSWSEDAGENPLFTYTPTTANQKEKIDNDSNGRTGGLARYYVSPLYTPNSSLAGMLCYSAQNSAFTLTFESIGNKTTTFELPETGEDPVWIEIGPGVPMMPGQWESLDIYAENASHDGSTNPTLKVFGVVITEAPGVTRYRSSLQLSALNPPGLLQPASTNLTYVGFETLDDTLADDTLWMDADLLSRIQWFKNALWEGILDVAAPGRTSQVVRGHDHEDYGGLSITRNKVCSFGMGQAQPWTVTFGSGEGNTSTPATADATWIKADRDTGGAGNGLRYTAGIAHMTGPVGPGIDNSSNPPTAAPFLDAFVYVSATGGGASSYTIRVAIYNHNQTAFSTVGTYGVSGADGEGWIYIDKIPCQADQFNTFTIYVQCTAGNPTFYVTYCQISESAYVSGSRVSQPNSSGATLHLAAPPDQGGTV